MGTTQKKEQIAKPTDHFALVDPTLAAPPHKRRPCLAFFLQAQQGFTDLRGRLLLLFGFSRGDHDLQRVGDEAKEEAPAMGGILFLKKRRGF